MYGAIDGDGCICHDYYNIIFSSSLHNIQADLSINSQVIVSGEMVCEGSLFLINFNSHYYGLQKNDLI